MVCNMIISISNPSHIYPIYVGTINQRTRIQSKKDIDSQLKLYFRYGEQPSCVNCLVSPKVTGRKCPIFDPKTYSTHCRCPSYGNFLGNANVTDIHNYPSFKQIKDKKAWALNEGFKTIKEAKECYSKLMGESWETYPLTVIKWEMVRRK